MGAEIDFRTCGKWGREVPVEVFVAILGGSGLTYVEGSGSY